MKTLYIDINNTPIANTPELEVLSIDLKRDFYYSLGKSVKGRVRGISSNIDLIADYISSGEDATVINQAWEQVKEILFSDNPEEEVRIVLPQSYVDWLRYNNNETYRNLYEQLYKGTSCISVAVDVAEIYEEAVGGTLFRQIKKRLEKDIEIEELVFNDNCVSRKSAIVRKLKSEFNNVVFVPLELWIEPEQSDIEKIVSSCLPEEEEKEDQIVAVFGGPYYSFINRNGDICNPESCRHIGNSCYYLDALGRLPFLNNFYHKQHECFYISSEGIKSLGSHSDFCVLNEELLAVQGEDAFWKILDKDARLVNFPSLIYKIYGVNSLGLVLCEMSVRQWLKTSSKLCLVNIHNGEVVDLNLKVEEINDICMDPRYSLILLRSDINGWYYYSPNTGISNLMNKIDGKIENTDSRSVRIVGNDIVIYEKGCNHIVLYVPTSHRITIFQSKPNDWINGFITSSFDKYFLDIENGNVISGRLESSFGDFYVKMNNEKRYKLCKKGSNDVIENTFELLFSIKTSIGLYAFIKYDNRLVWTNLEDTSKRRIITANLPLTLNREEDFFIYSYNESVINLCLLASNGKMYTYSLNYSGEIIAQDECGMNFMSAISEDEIHYLVDSNKIEIRNKNNKVLSRIQLPIECIVAVPCKNGYKLLTSDALYRYEIDSMGGKLKKIGDVNWAKTLGSSLHTLGHILFVDFNSFSGGYYKDIEGIKNSNGDLLFSAHRLPQYADLFLMYSTRYRWGRTLTANVCNLDIYRIIVNSQY